MTMQLFDANNGELMAISGLERDGDVLVIKGKIYGAMPMNAYLRPEELRKAAGLLSLQLILFLLTMPFRGKHRPKA
jgi:hypothetical protein